MCSGRSMVIPGCLVGDDWREDSFSLFLYWSIAYWRKYSYCCCNSVSDFCIFSKWIDVEYLVSNCSIGVVVLWLIAGAESCWILWWLVWSAVTFIILLSNNKTCWLTDVFFLQYIYYLHLYALFIYLFTVILFYDTVCLRVVLCGLDERMTDEWCELGRIWKRWAWHFRFCLYLVPLCQLNN
jgi:hypothetical protein